MIQVTPPNSNGRTTLISAFKLVGNTGKKKAAIKEKRTVGENKNNV
jgi:hypothetical protein